MGKAIVIEKEPKSDLLPPKETYYLLIVDASSSMKPLTESTISGVNEQIDSVKDLEKEFTDQKYHMSFIHFNSAVTVEYTDKSVSKLEHINNDNYKCSGMTAMLDAIGTGVTKLNERIKDKVATGEAAAVVVIITDGEENSSREFEGTKVRSMIEELQKTNRWTFTFVGANIDALSTARKFGISDKNVMQFSSDVSSNSRVYASLSKSMKMRGSSIATAGVDYMADEFIDKDDKDLTTKK